MGGYLAVCAANTVVLCAEALAECPVFMQRTAPFQRRRDVPNLSNDSLNTDATLAFAERLLLAINRH